MDTAKQSFSKRIRKVLDILESFNVYWYDFKWVDEFSVEIVLDNNVTLFIDREPSSIIIYDVGYIKESGGSYWEPPDYDYISNLTTKHMHLAITEVLLIPKRWEIQDKIENMMITLDTKPIETIFDKD
jgi:hypothetical protein